MTNKILSFVYAMIASCVMFGLVLFGLSSCEEGTSMRECHQCGRIHEGVSVFDTYTSKINSQDLNIKIGDVFYKNIYHPYNMIDGDGNNASPYVDYENPDYFEKGKDTINFVKGEKVKYDMPSEENTTPYSIVVITQVMPKRLKGYITHENGKNEDVNDILSKFTRSTNYFFINSKGMLEMAETGVDKEADAYRKKTNNYCIGNITEARKWSENIQVLVTHTNDSTIMNERVFLVKYSDANSHKDIEPEDIQWDEKNWCGVLTDEKQIGNFIESYSLNLVQDKEYKIYRKFILNTFRVPQDHPKNNDYFYVEEVYLPKQLIEFLNNNKLLNTIKY